MDTTDSNIKPHFITKHFLENILKSPVESYRVTEGSSPGDNFLCILYTIEIRLKESKEKPIFLIMKMYPNHPARKKFLDDSNCFHKELLVYTEYVPELTAFQEQIRIATKPGRNLKLAFPPLIHGEAVNYENESRCEDVIRCNTSGDTKDNQIQNYLLMVDIRKTWGFKMANKFLGLDYYHVKLVIHEIAKFHALGWAYKNKHGLKKLEERFPFLKDFLFSDCALNHEIMDALIIANSSFIQGILEKNLGKDNPAVKSFVNSTEKFVDSFSKFTNSDGLNEKEMEKLLRIKPSEELEHSEAWVVANHGDCWVNNMLFLYEDGKTGKPSETMLVDLQLVRETCPTIDLAYFLYTSTDTEFRRKHLDEMLSIYHSSFLEFCKLFQVKSLPHFTIETLRRRFHRAKLFGFISALLVLPIILQTPGKNDLDKYDTPDDGSMAEMLAKCERDDSEIQTISERFISLTQEVYSEGII